MKKILCLLLFLTFFSFNYVNAGNQSYVNNIMDKFYFKLDNSSLDINYKLITLEKIHDKIITIKNNTYNRLTYNSKDLLNLMELSINNKITLYKKELNGGNVELDINNILGNISDIGVQNNSTSNTDTTSVKNNLKKKTVLDCTKNIEGIYGTTDGSDKGLTCLDDIIICTGDKTGITIAACNAGATEVYNGQSFGGVSNTRNTYINSWAGGLYQWGSNIDVSLDIKKMNTDFNLTKKLRNTYSWPKDKSVCNKGYHIPTDEEWFNLISIFGFKRVGGVYDFYDKASTSRRADFLKKIKLPLAGNIAFDYQLGFIYQDQGSGLDYWASTSEKHGMAYEFSGYSGITANITWGDKTMQASSVRCFKD